MTKPKLDQGADYERGFVDGMSKQAQSSVDKAVNAMSQRTWVGLTLDDLPEDDTLNLDLYRGGRWAERVLKEKNNG